MILCLCVCVGNVIVMICIWRLVFCVPLVNLAVVDAARSSYADVHASSVRRKPARSSPVSLIVTSPVTSSSVAVVSSSAPFGSLARTSSVAVVSSSAPFGSLAHSSAVVAPSSSVAARPVAVSSVVSRPVSSGSLACPVSVSPVRPSPVVVPSVMSGPAGSGSAVPRFVRPRVPLSVGSSFGLPFGRPVGLSFVPVVCFVLAFVPVLIPSPFGLVWSFLPVWR